eukprot:4851577-Lingulodinium_polyedra.AAC.1
MFRRVLNERVPGAPRTRTECVANPSGSRSERVPRQRWGGERATAGQQEGEKAKHRLARCCVCPTDLRGP